MKQSSGQSAEQTTEESEEPFEVKREEDMQGEDVKPFGEDPTPSASRFVFEQAWMVAACVLLIAAAVLLYFGHPRAAFVAAALGVSAWFLNVRDDLKRKHDLVKQGGRNWESRRRGGED